MADPPGADIPVAQRARPRRWALVRGLAVLVLSAATSACSLALLGFGGFALVPLALVAAVIASAARSPIKWVFYGLILSAGLFIGGLRIPFFSRVPPSAFESAAWCIAGTLGLGMIVAGYWQALPDAIRAGPRSAATSPAEFEQKLRSASACAGFFGAVPFGLAVPILVSEWLRAGGPEPQALRSLLTGTLSLAPFAIAMARADRGGRSRVLLAALPGLAAGAPASYFLGALAALAAMASGVLGLIFGLTTLRACWSRGDAAGVAMSLLGTAPACQIVLLRLCGVRLG